MIRTLTSQLISLAAYTTVSMLQVRVSFWPVLLVSAGKKPDATSLLELLPETALYAI